MGYIEELIRGDIEPKEGQISLEEYLKESIYITKYMSPRIKATNIATYHAMFYLSYGENGVGSLSISWPAIGSLCGNERNTGTISKNEAIRERTKVLVELGCIEIKQNRTGVNDFFIYLPSQISFVKKALEQDRSKQIVVEKSLNIDCYNVQDRKIKLLERDNFTCQYCLAKVTEDTYYLDHIIPRAKGGTNYKNNLITSCQSCNSNKSDNSAEDFLLENYRKGLLKQSEYMKQIEYIKNIVESDTGEP